MADEKERIKIKVASAGTPKPLRIRDRDTVVIQFKGEDGIVYEAWEQALVDLVKPGAEIDGDVTHGEKDGIPVHRLIQAYDAAGKPIKQATGGGKRYGGYKDPTLEAASIESQVSAYIVKDLFIAGKLDELQESKNPLAMDLKAWLGPRLKHKYVEVKVEVKQAPTTSPTRYPPPGAAESKSAPPVEKTEAAPGPTEAATAPAKPNKVDQQTLTWMVKLVKEKGYEAATVQSIILREFPPATCSRELSQADASKLIKLLQQGYMLPEQKKLKEDIPF